MSFRDRPSLRNQALVAALQWGLVQTFLLNTLGRLLRNYYRATTDAFVAPSWVTSIQFAAPFALLVGGYGGYKWVTSGRATTTESAHRTRVVFVGALLAGWVLAILPTLLFGWLLGSRLFTVPYFLIPTLTALAVFVSAYLLAYRVDSTWYRQRRGRLLGAVQGASIGMIIGFIGFAAYASYLAATRTNYNLEGTPGILIVSCLGAVVGYMLTGSTESGERAVEFLTLLISLTLGLSVITTLGAITLGILGLSLFDVIPSRVFALSPLIVAFVIATYLTYGARTTFYRRLTGNNTR